MSQYSLIVPGLYCRGLDRRLCHNTKFCIVRVDWARWACGRACWARGRGCWARGRACWARRQALGARLGAQATGALGRQARERERVCGRERARAGVRASRSERARRR